MAGSVQNTVSTVFTATDNTTAVLQRIQIAAQRANASVNLLNGRLRQVGQVAALGNVAGQLRQVNYVAAQLARNFQMAAQAARNLGTAAQRIKTPVFTGGAGGIAGVGGLAMGAASAGVLGEAGAAYAVQRLGSSAISATKNVVALHENYENLKWSLSGQLQATGMATSFKDASAQATTLMTDLRHMAAKLPGDLNYYAQMVQEASVAMFKSGIGGMKEALDFVGHYGATVYAIAQRHGSLGMSARNLFQMLGGVARTQMPIYNFLRANLNVIDLPIKKFNELSRSARLEWIQKALAGYADATANAFDLTSAKMGEFNDRIREIMRGGTIPFMKDLKESLDKINKTLADSEGPLKGMVHQFQSLAKYMLPVLGLIAAPIGGRLFKRFVAAPLAASGAAMATTLGGVGGGAMASAIVPVAYIAQSFKGVGASVPMFIRAVGAFLSLANVLRNVLRITLVWSIVIDGLIGLIKNTGGWTAKLTSALDRMFGTVDAIFTKIFGMGLFEMLEQLLPAALTVLVEALNYMIQAALTISYMFKDMTFNVVAAWEKAGAFMDVAMKERIAKRTEAPGAPYGGIVIPKETPTNNYDFRYSRFDIKQNFAEGFDPDRIAVAFANDLSRLGEMRVSSQFAPLFGVR